MANLEKFEDKNKFLKQFEGLRPDLFFPEEWTEDQRNKALELVRPKKIRTLMFASIPMRCLGKECIYEDMCPFHKENIDPKGKPCPVEMSMVSQFALEYMEQLDVHEDNLVEVSMIRDLVDQEIQYLRKTKLLAKEHFIQENIIGIDTRGNPIMKKELHLAVELEDRLHKRKRDLRNQLLATREAKAKVGQMQIDSAQAISDIMYKVQAIEIQKEKMLRQKLGTYEVDDYIEAQTVNQLETPLDEVD